MLQLFQSMRNLENKIQDYVKGQIPVHPLLFGLGIFLGMPVLILLAVSAAACAVIVPIGLLMGWV